MSDIQLGIPYRYHLDGVTTLVYETSRRVIVNFSSEIVILNVKYKDSADLQPKVLQPTTVITGFGYQPTVYEVECQYVILCSSSPAFSSLDVVIFAENVMIIHNKGPYTDKPSLLTCPTFGTKKHVISDLKLSCEDDLTFMLNQVLQVGNVIDAQSYPKTIPAIVHVVWIDNIDNDHFY